MIGKAKRLKREGHSMPFQEIAIEGVTDREIEQLDIIENTFTKYMQNLPKITKSMQI